MTLAGHPRWLETLHPPAGHRATRAVMPVRRPVARQPVRPARRPHDAGSFTC
jgi:hypothetical protein